MQLFKRKKKPQKTFEYEFEADKGQFSCVFSIDTDKSKLFDFYNEHFRSKLAKVLNPDEVFRNTKEWELGPREKSLCLGKLRKRLLEPALEKVREDLPRFKPHHVLLETVKFTEIAGDKYTILVKFGGLCEGDDETPLETS